MDRSRYTISGHSEKGSEWRRLVAAEKKRCERARGKCALCHRLINTNLQMGVDPMSFTLDHIVPVSQGGARVSRENTRWAHMRCNSERGDGSSQKLLVTSRRW